MKQAKSHYCRILCRRPNPGDLITRSLEGLLLPPGSYANDGQILSVKSDSPKENPSKHVNIELISADTVSTTKNDRTEHKYKTRLILKWASQCVGEFG